MFLLLNVAGLCQGKTDGGPGSKVTGYFSFVHPIVSLSEEGSSFNFSNGGYKVGFPFGLNLMKTEKLIFSMEFAPTLQVQDGRHRAGGLTVHPGVIFPREHGISYLARLAFSTSGRYGFTLVFNKKLFKMDRVKYYFAIPLPFRFGRGKPPSLTPGLQLGVSF